MNVHHHHNQPHQSQQQQHQNQFTLLERKIEAATEDVRGSPFFKEHYWIKQRLLQITN